MIDSVAKVDQPDISIRPSKRSGQIQLEEVSDDLRFYVSSLARIIRDYRVARLHVDLRMARIKADAERIQRRVIDERNAKQDHLKASIAQSDKRIMYLNLRLARARAKADIVHSETSSESVVSFLPVVIKDAEFSLCKSAAFNRIRTLNMRKIQMERNPVLLQGPLHLRDAVSKQKRRLRPVPEGVALDNEWAWEVNAMLSNMRDIGRKLDSARNCGRKVDKKCLRRVPRPQQALASVSSLLRDTEFTVSLLEMFAVSFPEPSELQQSNAAFDNDTEVDDMGMTIKDDSFHHWKMDVTSCRPPLSNGIEFVGTPVLVAARGA